MSDHYDEIEQQSQQKVRQLGNYAKNHTNRMASKAANKALAPAKKAANKAKQKAKQSTKKATNKAAKATSKAAKKTAKVGAKVATKVGKAAVKLAGKAAIKLGALLGKGLVMAVSFLATIGLPILAGLAIIGSLIGFCYFVELDSRPVNQNLQDEKPSQMNTQEFSQDRPQGVVTEISDYNLVVNAFYMNYAMDSYHRLYEGELYGLGEIPTVKPVVKRDNNSTVEADEPIELKDAKNLESQFLLSYELLWQLDEYLHDKKFKYPESFLKPLYYEKTGEGKDAVYTLKDLTDENGNLIAQSNVYDENGTRVENEQTEGVWDYGLAPILSYKVYLKDSRYEYDVVGKSYHYEYTLPEGAVVPSGQSSTIQDVKPVTLTIEEADKHVKEDDYLDYSFIPMIDKAMTFVGTFTPTIAYNWERNPNAVKTFTEETESKELTKEYDITFEKMVPKTNSKGKLVKQVRRWSGTKVAQVVEGCYRVETVIKEHPQTGKPTKYYLLNTTCGTTKTIATSQYPFTFEEILVKKTVTEPVKVKVTEAITYTQYLSEIEPRYVGDPQVTDFKGGKYLKDYIQHYESQVPETVLSDLDLANRVSKDPEKLQEIVDEYNAMMQGGNAVSDLQGDVGEFSQGAFNNAARYLDLFQKYAKRYGVDPYLLLAKAAQESSGDHESHLTGNAAIGLMQIEQPGSVVTQAKAYNHETKQDEIVKVCKGNSNSPAGCLNVYNLENNIRVGAMQLAQRYSVFGGHHMLALQSYNFGEGGMRKTVSLCGLDVKDVQKDQYNLDWMKCRMELHQNPQYVGHAQFDKNGNPRTYGDPVYIENVLKFYQNPETNNHLTYTDREGTVHQFDISKIDIQNGGFIFSTTGSSSGGGLFSSLGKFLKNRFEKIVDSLASLFEDVPKHYELPKENARYYKSELAAIDVEVMEKMIFAMKQQISLDEVGEVTDEMWKERYADLFVNHKATSVNSFEGETDPYFDGGARTPLPFEIDPFFVFNYNASIDGVRNPGVGLVASPGVSIHAIFDGTILKVGDSGGYRGYSVHIQHANGMVSVYNRLDPSTVKVQEGATISKGDIIASVATADDPKQQYFHFELQENGLSVNPTFLFENSSGGDYFVPPSSGTFTIPLLHGYVTWEFEDPGYPGHRGIDLGNNGDTTTPVIASAPGTVSQVRFEDGNAYGNAVYIDHMIEGKLIRTVYAHMHNRPLVKVGDVVKQGQQLGTMGDTGNSEGAHLHFEVREGSSYSDTVNPRKYVTFPTKKRVPW